MTLWNRGPSAVPVLARLRIIFGSAGIGIGIGGVLPIGMAFDESSGWLLVAEAGINAIGVIDTHTVQHAILKPLENSAMRRLEDVLTLHS